MFKTKTLVAFTSAFISMNSFALVCQTNMVRGNGSLIDSFFGEGISETDACRESRKQCRLTVRRAQRNGQLTNADCILIGVVGNGNPIPDPTPIPDPVPNPGNFSYELDQIEREYNQGGWRVRQTVIGDLTRFPSPRAIKIALKALKDNDSDVRRTAGNVVNQLPSLMNLDYDSIEILASITPLLNSSAWLVRQKTAVVMGKLPTAEGIIPLLGSLNDSDSDVRNSVKNSITKLSRNYDFKDMMRRNVEALKRLSNSGSWLTRQLTVKLVGESQIKRLVVIAVKLAGDSDSDVRNAASKAVRSITSSRGFDRVGLNTIEKLGSLSRASSWNTRVQAVYALGETRNYAARTYVLRALDDNDSDVRNAARIALNKI
jgi:HEAT repeat protein